MVFLAKKDAPVFKFSQKDTHRSESHSLAQLNSLIQWMFMESPKAELLSLGPETTDAIKDVFLKIQTPETYSRPIET